MSSRPIRKVPDARDTEADAAPGKPAEVRARVEVPWSTFAKGIVAVLITIAVLRFLEQIATVAVMGTLALFLVAVLDPVAVWLEKRGLGRGLASVLSVGGAVLVVLGLLALIIPPLVGQAVELAGNMPDLVLQFRRWLSAYPAVFDALEGQAQAVSRNPAEFFTGFLRYGTGAVSTVVSGVLTVTLALYVLIDHVRIRAAVLRHVPPAYRDRVDRTITEGGAAVRAYFTGQAIVSSLFAALTFILLTILGVPYASVLAAAAFFLDAIPNIGATLATIAPALAALVSQGPVAALIVVAVILVYQQIENNLISPRIISGKLQIPPVLTLIAVLVGGAVLGVVGVIIAIPLAGTLPVIDRIWFTPDTVRQHER
jgi:predicted PurR-regulated permease PerM